MMEKEYKEPERLTDTPQVEEEKPAYTPRPRWQIVFAWVLIAIVVFGFLGYCYWIANS